MTGKGKKWFAIALVAAAVYGIGNLYSPTVVVGDSMSPTLSDGRVVWVDRTYYLNHCPQRGEVVVFKYGGEIYIKRVYRAPGETLSYVGNGTQCILPIRESAVAEAQE